MLLPDTSVISEFRIGTTHISPQKIELLLGTLDKFDLSFENTFITDKLFAEVLGYGKVRLVIKKSNRQIFDDERNKIAALLKKDEAEYKEAIDSYIDFIEQLFSTHFKNAINQSKLQSELAENLKTFPFTTELSSFEKKLTEYTDKLHSNSCLYEKFIEMLTEDSVIRYSLDAINIDCVAPKDLFKALKILEKTIKTLLIRYQRTEILNSNLNLVMSALKKHGDKTLNRQSRFEPLFRVDDDLADPELEHFSLHGVRIREEIFPVTAISTEPETAINQRLIYNFQAIGTKVETRGNQHLLPGRILIFDFQKLTFKEIPVREFINKNFKYVSGKNIL